MTTSTFEQPNYTANLNSTSYPLSIDAAIAVMARVAASFAPHEQATPNMTVRVDAGSIPAVGAKPTEVSAQNSATITAPSVNPRQDIIYIDKTSGAVGVATGAESASPSDPSVPSGKIVVARVNLAVGQTEIVNADIDDLRQLGLLGGISPSAADISGTISLSGDISPAQITANQNDYNPTGLSGASTLRLSTDASRDITGLAGGADGRILLIHNVGSYNLVLKDESGSSAAANRFALSSDITLSTDQCAILQYDATTSRWRCLASSSSSVSSASTPLGSVSVTNSATLFIDWTNNGYDKVLVVCIAKPVTDGATMRFRLRQGGADVSSSGAYRTGAASDTYAYLAGDVGVGSDTNEWGVFANYQISNPGSATSYKDVQADENWINASSGNPTKTTTTWGFMANASAVTGMTIYAATGNVTGIISAIGIKGATS